MILDIHQDAQGRLIYTNPDDSSIYMIDGDDIIFISSFIVRKFFPLLIFF